MKSFLCRIVTYPGYMCSRTDFEWVSSIAPPKKEQTAQKEKDQTQIRTTPNKSAAEKDREIQRPKPKTELNVSPAFIVRRHLLSVAKYPLEENTFDAKLKQSRTSFH